MIKNNLKYRDLNEHELNQFKCYTGRLRDYICKDNNTEEYVVRPDVFEEFFILGGATNNPVNDSEYYKDLDKEFFPVKYIYSRKPDYSLIIRQPKQRKKGMSKASMLLVSPSKFMGYEIETYNEYDRKRGNAPFLVLNLSFDDIGVPYTESFKDGVFSILANGDWNFNLRLLRYLADNYELDIREVIRKFCAINNKENYELSVIYKYLYYGYEFTITYIAFFSLIQDIMRIEEDVFPSKSRYKGRYMMVEYFEKFVK